MVIAAGSVICWQEQRASFGIDTCPFDSRFEKAAFHFFFRLQRIMCRGKMCSPSLLASTSWPLIPGPCLLAPASSSWPLPPGPYLLAPCLLAPTSWPLASWPLPPGPLPLGLWVVLSVRAYLARDTSGATDCVLCCVACRGRTEWYQCKRLTGFTHTHTHLLTQSIWNFSASLHDIWSPSEQLLRHAGELTTKTPSCCLCRVCLKNASICSNLSSSSRGLLGFPCFTLDTSSTRWSPSIIDPHSISKSSRPKCQDVLALIVGYLKREIHFIDASVCFCSEHLLTPSSLKSHPKGLWVNCL